MLPESFPARGEHLSQQWPLLESLDLSSFEPGKTLTSAVVAELTSGAKQLVNTHIQPHPVPRDDHDYEFRSNAP